MSKKRIVVCADGTWNRPEKDLEKDVPSNVLRIARAIEPMGDDHMPQQVFYDWGVGSYYDPIVGGLAGKGLNKNIMDCYRYIVQNYSPGDEVFLFGFSRGAYTVRSLCGLINNCGIIKRTDAHLIQKAFTHFKTSGNVYKPEGEASVEFRQAHSHASREVTFIGVWDTVGALGIPFSVLGLLDSKDEFYDTKLGANVSIARHALAIDERRSDFEPTIWLPRSGIDLKQVWFAGVHGDVGGAYEPENQGGSRLSDISLDWMMREAEAAGLKLEAHLRQNLRPSPTATLHQSLDGLYRLRSPFDRPIDHGKGTVLLHSSVKQRYDRCPDYRPKNLEEYISNHGWPDDLVP